MGGRERSKGVRRERELVRRLRAAGIPARRVPLSGAAGRDRCDLVLSCRPGWRLCVEVKARNRGWATLHRWLDGVDALILCADRKEPLVVLPLSVLEDMLRYTADRSDPYFAEDRHG